MSEYDEAMADELIEGCVWNEPRHVDVDCQIKDDAAVDMENDLDAFVWSTVFADTGDRDAAASAVDRYHREPSYYMVLVDLMAERRSAYPLPGR